MANDAPTSLSAYDLRFQCDAATQIERITTSDRYNGNKYSQLVHVQQDTDMYVYTFFELEWIYI